MLRGVHPDTLASGGDGGGDGSSVSSAAIAARLEQLVQQLQGLKRKLEATSLSEREDLGRCRARLQHLRELGAPPKDAQVEWNRRRIDGLLVDHLLRGGYNQAAAALATSSGIQVGRRVAGGACSGALACGRPSWPLEAPSWTLPPASVLPPSTLLPARPPARSLLWSSTSSQAPGGWWRRCGGTTAGRRWPGVRTTGRACGRPRASWSSSCGCRWVLRGGCWHGDEVLVQVQVGGWLPAALLPAACWAGSGGCWSMCGSSWAPAAVPVPTLISQP